MAILVVASAGYGIYAALREGIAMGISSQIQTIQTQGGKQAVGQIVQIIQANGELPIALENGQTIILTSKPNGTKK